jgi:hypothetical protein
VARSRKKAPAEILHSEEEPASVLFVVFIPSKTKDGDDLPAGEDQQMWADAVSDVLTRQFGGATIMPVAKGKWGNDEREIITEEVVLVHSYAQPSHAEEENRLHQIAVILHRMGKRTKQGEVGILIDGIFHKIRKFPLADAEDSE